MPILLGMVEARSVNVKKTTTYDFSLNNITCTFWSMKIIYIMFLSVLVSMLYWYSLPGYISKNIRADRSPR